MKINDKRKKSVLFGDLKPGTVFVFADNYCMKTETTYVDNNGDYDNVVLLETGELLSFKDSTEVDFVRCELVIEM